MNGTFSQLVMLGSSGMLLTALIVLWRKGVAAYITAYRWQAWLLAALTATVGYYGGDRQLYWVAALLMGLKGLAIPALLRTMQRRFIGFGLLSVLIGTFSVVIQRHYKRMLAYSSVEHMGLVSIGLALGPLGAFAALLHVVNHAVAKSMSFLVAGRILHRYETTEIGKVTGLLRVMPWTGALFAVGVLALVGLPPFGLFISEFLLVRAAVVTGRFWVAGVVLVLLLTVFTSLVNHLNRMLYGEAPTGVPVGERRGWSVAALVLAGGVVVVLGVALPRPFSTLITQSVRGVIP